MKIFFSSDIRAAEAYGENNGFSTARMMENAGSAAANTIIEKFQYKDSAFVILAGSGNNGGDGFVVARKLYEAGANVSVILVCGMPGTNNSKEALSRLSDFPIRIYNANDYECIPLIKCADYIIDAVFGIGFHGDLQGQVHSLINASNKSNAKRIALDLPSGCECDSGRVGNLCFNADITITFIGVKPCHVLFPASDYCGKLVMVGIGLPKEALNECKSNVTLISDDYVKSAVPRLKKNSHKGSQGTALQVCGSYGMAGAAILSAKAALKCGAGLVKAVLPASIYPIAAASLLEAVYIPCGTLQSSSLEVNFYENIAKALTTANAMLIGCGCGNSKEFAALALALIENSSVPTVIDADGINALCGNIDILLKSSAPIILTPHPAEMARLLKVTTADIVANRFKVASAFAAKFGVTLVLKGANTVVALNDGSLYVCMHGNPGMATGGSGDVLAGIISALLAQGMTPQDAAICGVNIHAAAGDIAAANNSMHSMLPSDIIDSLAQLFKQIEC